MDYRTALQFTTLELFLLENNLNKAFINITIGFHMHVLKIAIHYLNLYA